MADISNYRLNPSSKESYTNQVLFQKSDTKMVYYLPVYLRMTVRRVHHIELESSIAQVSGTLIFSIFYGGLPGNEVMQPDSDDDDPEEDPKKRKLWYIKKLKQKVELKINGQDGFIFDSSKDIFVENSLNISHDKHKKLLSYTIRDSFQCDVDGNIALTPFETLNLYIQFSLRTIEAGYNTDGQKVQLKFNMMDTDQPSIKLQVRMRTTTGQYGVGEKKCSMVYTNSLQTYCKDKPEVHLDNYHSNNLQKQTVGGNNQEDDKKIAKYWQNANMKIVLYKYPMTTIFSIMMPMWILAVIVQISFFQQNELGGRISTVAIALVAYMAFIPSVRQKLPPSPNFTFIEIVIVMLLITSMLTAARAWIDKQILGQYDYVWYQDPLFIITLVLNLVTLLATIIITIVFYCYFHKQYTDGVRDGKGAKLNFKMQKWKNLRADEYFRNKAFPVINQSVRSLRNIKVKPIEGKKQQE